MANTKMTKVQYFGQVAEIVEASNAENKTEILEFIQHEIELLNNKSSKSTETKAQKSSAAIQAVVLEVLADIGKPVTVTDLMEDSRLQAYTEETKDGSKQVKMTNQKLSSVLKKLFDMKQVSKTYEKKKAYFSLPDESAEAEAETENE